MATITAPLRELTKKDAKWKWKNDEQKALDRRKSELTGDRAMTYFDPCKKIGIIADAGPVGIGRILLQEGKVISCASRAQSEVENRYLQTERKMLAAVCASEHFQLYDYGQTLRLSQITNLFLV